MTLTARLPFAKGHATGNDFVLISDPEGALDLTAERVALWCDRHRGIGGDGLIRAVRTAAIHEGAGLLQADPRAEWFMDYRNADGSIAEMCGNGVRAFVHFLRAEGLVSLAVGEELAIGTRAGVKTVVRVAADAVAAIPPETSPEGVPGLGETAHYAVDLGPWSLAEPEKAQAQGADAVVHAPGLDVPRPALSVSMGNPHTVLALAHEEELAAVSLHAEPQVEPRPLAGTNVEFVVPQEHGIHDGYGEISMRVYERGVGETLSCGTGAAAAAAAVRFWAGPSAPSQWAVSVPGGTVRVTFQPSPDGTEHCVLSGPAVVVARGDAAL